MAAQEYYGSSPPLDIGAPQARTVAPYGVSSPTTSSSYRRDLPPYGSPPLGTSKYSLEFPPEQQRYGPPSTEGAQGYIQKFGGQGQYSLSSPISPVTGQFFHPAAATGAYNQVSQQQKQQQQLGAYSQAPPGYDDPNAPPGERGLGSTMLGGAAGGYLAHQAGGSFLGTVGGAIGGAIAANIVGHEVKKHRKEKKEKKERKERREKKEKRKQANSHTTSLQIVAGGGHSNGHSYSGGHSSGEGKYSAGYSHSGEHSHASGHSHSGGKTSSSTLQVAVVGGRRPSPKHRRHSSTHGTSGHAISGYGSSTHGSSTHGASHGASHGVQSSHTSSYTVSHSSSRRRRDSSSSDDRSYSRHSSHSRTNSHSQAPKEGILNSLYAYGYSTGGGHAFSSGASERSRSKRDHHSRREHREHRDHHHKSIGSAASYDSKSSRSSNSRNSSESSSSSSSSDSRSDSRSDSEFEKVRRKI